MNPDPQPPFPLSLLRFWTVQLLPMWTAIALIIFGMQIAVCAIVHDNESVRAFLQFLEVLPSFIKTALGGDLLQAGNTAALIAIGYQHPLVLFLYLLFAVGVPTRFLTREVQTGHMEILLSRSVSKTAVYCCATFLTLFGMFSLIVVMFLGTVCGTSLFDFGDPVPLDFFARLAVNGGLLAGTAGGIALFAAGAWIGRPAAVTAPIAFLVASYFVWVIAQWWPTTSCLKPFTLFYYASSSKLTQGWPLGDLALLGALLIITTLLGGILWHRRDLPL